MSTEVKPADIKQRYEENPFVDRFQIPLKPKSQKLGLDTEMYITTTGGEVVSGAEVRQTILVDSDKFVKVFTNHLSSFFDLTQRSQKIIEVVMAELSRLPPASDQVFLNAASVESYFTKKGRKPPSRATFTRALDELVRKGFVAYSDRPGLFYINPAIFFNGDRARFVTEFRRKRAQGRADARQLGLPLEMTEHEQMLDAERRAARERTAE